MTPKLQTIPGAGVTLEDRRFAELAPHDGNLRGMHHIVNADRIEHGPHGWRVGPRLLGRGLVEVGVGQGIRPSRKRGFPALPQATGLQKSALDAPGTEEEDRKAAVAEARRRYAEGADGRLLILA